MEDQLSDQTGDRDSDFDLIFATLKQSSDGTSRFEHYLSASQQIYLGYPATSIISERTFWTAGNIVTSNRSSLYPDKVNLLAFLHTNRAFLNS
ncbi:hypothetical protein PR048_033396 [Dryococelus australis]|uniref:HAT C-terminal dimerisation domain-containing protein n=1 Tax=Dryococelus australis TaxID=614101 RepID=A0ABQ9G3H7_9NEOP|nr:hypothetical protein PR048_033396 [Dryococelus australis]